MGLRGKLILFQTAIIFLATGLIAWFAYQRRAAEIYDDFQTHVMRTAGTAALNIDGDSLAAIRTNEDASSSAFQKVERILEEARNINGLSAKEIYVLRPAQQEFDTEFVAMVETPRYIGNRYFIRPENQKAYRAALETSEPQHTDLYKDAHGTWISGYGPIKDSSGKTVAILEVDTEVSKVLAKKNRDLAMLLGLTFGMTLLGVGATMALTKPVTGGILRLRDAFKRIEAGEYPQVDQPGADEVAQAVKGFNAMSYGLHLSRYQLQEAVGGLNRVAERAPALFLSEDPSMIVMIVLENIVANERTKDAEAVCNWKRTLDGDPEHPVTLGAWPDGAVATEEQGFPITINERNYGDIHVRWKERPLPIDVALARTWSEYLAAILAAREISEERSREAKSAGIDAAGVRFLSQLKDIEQNLAEHQPAPTSGGAERPSGFQKAVRRIELVRKDIGLLAAQQAPQAAQPVGAVISRCLDQFRLRHGKGYDIRPETLTSVGDTTPEPARLEKALLTLLDHSARQQTQNPQDKPPFIELLTKTSKGAIRIVIHDNAPPLPQSGPQSPFESESAQTPADDALLSLSTTKLTIESMRGTVEYHAGTEFGTVFSIRVPQPAHAA